MTRRFKIHKISYNTARELADMGAFILVVGTIFSFITGTLFMFVYVTLAGIALIAMFAFFDYLRSFDFAKHLMNFWNTHIADRDNDY